MRLYLAAVLFITSFSAHAALHKWVDADGVVHYSDSVPESVTKSQTLRSIAPGPTSSSSTAPTKSLAEKEAEMKKAQQAKDQAAEQANKEKELAEAQKQNCNSARERLSTLQNAPRIATYNEAGEQVIMEDGERQKRIDEATKAISQYCK